MPPPAAAQETGTDAEPAPGDGAAPDDNPASAESAETEPEAPPAEARPDPQAAAAEINARVSGWRYRIAEYKADQLTRGWDDLLKAVDDPE